MTYSYHINLFEIIDWILGSGPKRWVGNDTDFFRQKNPLKSLVDQDDFVCVVHCKFAGVRLPEDLDFLHWIRSFYQNTDKNSRLIFIHCDYYPELEDVEKIKFIHFPQYFAYYYPVYRDYVISPNILEKIFFSVNKRATMDRQIFYRAFYHHGLLDKSWFSYVGQSFNPGDLENDDHCNMINNYVFNWLNSEENLGKWDEVLQWESPKETTRFLSAQDKQKMYDDFASWDDNKMRTTGLDEPTWLIDTKYYDGSFCSVVHESDPLSWRINISEKTMRCIAYGHPFVIVGCKHTVKTLRDLGFDMFDDVLDHSYDNVDNGVLRLKAVWESVRKISEMSLESLQEIKNSLLSRRRRNQNLLAEMYEEMFSKEKEIVKDLELLLNIPLSHFNHDRYKR